MKNEALQSRLFRRAFYLIELMVSMGILSILLLMMTAVLSKIQDSWNFSEARIGEFREARVAFDLLSKNLSQATMNTYLDLKVDKNNVPEGYEKTSELQFLTIPAKQITGTSNFQLTGQALFFQAPLGFSTRFRNLNNLFNGRGYFVGYGDDQLFRPSFVKSAPKYRFRLIEFRPPAEANEVFEDGMEERLADQRQKFTKWFNQSGGIGRFQDYLNPLAENIITLVVAPRDSLSEVGQKENDTYSEIAPGYQFNSNSDKASFDKYSQQVPPLVRVTMVAIDEAAAVRLADRSGATMPALVSDSLFQNTRDYQKDVLALDQSLNDQKIKHKIFSTLVMLRSAKWSTSSTQN